jgi:hypothetical protein
MKEEKGIKELEQLLVGGTILSVEENESGEDGMKLILDTGIVIDICFVDPGWCKIII